MAKTNGKKTAYTPRFGSQSSLRSTKKCALGEKKAKGGPNADTGPRPPTDIKQTLGAEMNLKAKRAKTAKPFSTARKEESGSQKTTLHKTTQTSNICQKAWTDKDISRKGSPLTQKDVISKMNEDAFTFSYPERLVPSKTSAMKEVVLKTISKMVEENKGIRRRLMSCRQGNNTGTGSTCLDAKTKSDLFWSQNGSMRCDLNGQENEDKRQITITPI